MVSMTSMDIMDLFITILIVGSRLEFRVDILPISQIEVQWGHQYFYYNLLWKVIGLILGELSDRMSKFSWCGAKMFTEFYVRVR